MPNKKNKKDLLIVPWITMIISGVMLIFVIIIFGYITYYTTVLKPILALADQQALLEQKVETTMPEADLQEVAEEEAIAVEVELSIYENKEFGYKVNYPSDWILDERYADYGVIGFLTKERDEKLKAGEYVRLFDVGIVVYENAEDLPNNDDGLSFYKWINRQEKENLYKNKTSAIVDGVYGYAGQEIGEVINYVIYVQKDGIYGKGKIYKIMTGESETPNKIEKQIIDSFEFID